MTTLTPAALLAAWERCLPLSPVRRAVTLLEFAEPSLPAKRITALPLGSRDRALLRLQGSAFGGEITGLVACPECATTVQIVADVDTIISSVPDASPDDEELTVDRKGYHVSFRLPTSDDLIALGASPPETEPERFLLARCLRWVEHEGSPVAASELPNEIVELIGSSMSDHDPLANIELASTCLECGHSWAAPLDIAAFLWTELSDHATRLLQDVHVLASAYGWREGDVLALTPTRRRAYLELIAG